MDPLRILSEVLFVFCVLSGLSYPYNDLPLILITAADTESVQSRLLFCMNNYLIYYI